MVKSAVVKFEVSQISRKVLHFILLLMQQNSYCSSKSKLQVPKIFLTNLLARQTLTNNFRNQTSFFKIKPGGIKKLFNTLSAGWVLHANTSQFKQAKIIPKPHFNQQFEKDLKGNVWSRSKSLLSKPFKVASNLPWRSRAKFKFLRPFKNSDYGLPPHNLRNGQNCKLQNLS